MLKPNTIYKELKDTYLFNTIYRKTNEYLEANPDKQVLRMGVGDVSLPLCDAVIKALHKAVDDQARFTGICQRWVLPNFAVPLRAIIRKWVRTLPKRISSFQVVPAMTSAIF